MSAAADVVSEQEQREAVIKSVRADVRPYISKKLTASSCCRA